MPRESRARPRPQHGAARAVRAVSAGALVSFTANCALGAGVASGVVDTHRVRWMHHALYIVTLTLWAATASSIFWGHRIAVGWVVLPAGLPLALIPRQSGRSPQHRALAAAAAPFIAGGAAWARRGDRARQAA